MTQNWLQETLTVMGYASPPYCEWHDEVLSAILGEVDCLLRSNRCGWPVYCPYMRCVDENS